MQKRPIVLSILLTEATPYHSMSSLIFAVGERPRGEIEEHDAFLGHEMRGPEGTGRGGVSMAWGREGQGAIKRIRVRGHRLPSPPWFVQNLLKYFGFLSQ